MLSFSSSNRSSSSLMAELGCCYDVIASSNASSPSSSSSRHHRKRPHPDPSTAAAAGDVWLLRSNHSSDNHVFHLPPESAVSSAAAAAGDECPRFGFSSVCGRRRDMEDAVSIRPEFFESDSKFHFFGVFDGHGCSHVATACRERMHKLMAEEMSNVRHGALAGRRWEEMMERSFERMDAEATELNLGSAGAAAGQLAMVGRCQCELQAPKCNHVGSTAVVAVVGPDRIVVANCGDSRAVLSRGGAAVPLSADHKPDQPEELRRIEAVGGRVIYWEGARVLGVLAVSRSIGDSYLKPYVTAEPETTITARKKEDECLILASDGLWDVISNETAIRVVLMCLRKYKPAPGGGERDEGSSDKACTVAAALLMKLAIAKGSADNVSVVVVDLRSS